MIFFYSFVRACVTIVEAQTAHRQIMFRMKALFIFSASLAAVSFVAFGIVPSRPELQAELMVSDSFDCTPHPRLFEPDVRFVDLRSQRTSRCKARPLRCSRSVVGELPCCAWRLTSSSRWSVSCCRRQGSAVVYTRKLISALNQGMAGLNAEQLAQRRSSINKLTLYLRANAFAGPQSSSSFLFCAFW